MKIEKNKVVTIHYTLKDNNNNILDSTEGDEPMSYLHGRDNLIPGLEAELEGKEKGDKFKASIKPEDAYGERDEDMMFIIPREQFQGVPDIEVGMQFQTDSPSGPMLITISEINGDEITVDGNHPLAGETLNFEVEVTGICNATEEEIAHGHLHAHDGGCCGDNQNKDCSGSGGCCGGH